MNLIDAVTPPIPFAEKQIVDDRQVLNGLIRKVEAERDEAIESNRAIMRLLFLTLNQLGGKWEIDGEDLKGVDFSGKFVDTQYDRSRDTLLVQIVDYI